MIYRKVTVGNDVHQAVAVKLYNIGVDRSILSYDSERDIVLTLNHENIIHTYHSFMTSNIPKHFRHRQYVLIMERGDTTLDKYLENPVNEFITTYDKLSIIIGITNGINALHQAEIVHNDLKVHLVLYIYTYILMCNFIG